MGAGSFSGVKRPAPIVDDPAHLTPRLKEEWAIPLHKLCVFVACSRVKFNFNVIIIIILYSINKVLLIMRERCVFCEVIYACLRIP